MSDHTPESPREFLRRPATIGLLLVKGAFVIVLAAAFVWWGNHQASVQDAKHARESAARAAALVKLAEDRAKEIRVQQIERRAEVRSAAKLLCEEDNSQIRVLRRLLMGAVEPGPRRKFLINLTNAPRDCNKFINARLPRLN